MERTWRNQSSGMRLQEEWSAFDARKNTKIPPIQGKANPACRCGDVLQGKCKPSDCKVFGKVCTPQHPVGACMVSGEGALFRVLYVRRSRENEIKAGSDIL
mgnify:CR=1 FL=1